MNQKKKGTAVFLVVVLLMSTMYCGNLPVSAAAVKTKAYTLSKKAGTYTTKVKVKLKAKKGYKVYYSRGGKFSDKKVTAKSKTFTFKKTTKLYVYGVKKKKKVTKTLFKKKAKKYTYKIKKKTNNTGTVTAQPDSSQSTAQEILDDALSDSAAGEVEATVSPVQITEDTPVIAFSQGENGAEVSLSEETGSSGAVTISNENGMCTVTVKKAGTYIFCGGTTENPVKNAVIQADTESSEDVTLVLDNLVIDNSALGTVEEQDMPVIMIAKKTKKAVIALKGESALTGNGSYTEEPAKALIYARDDSAVLTVMEQETGGTLTLTDALTQTNQYSDSESTDGITCKGTFCIQSGTVDICASGDGIQAENVKISGDNTKLSIRTYFKNAGKNYYSSSLGTGKYNTLTENGSVKTEQVNVDTGSHAGIKAGTKEKSYRYQSVADGSKKTVGTTYSEEASGGITISGGDISIDTTNTGIKYNSGNSGMGFGGNANQSGTVLEGTCILGSPGDAIHSNNTCTISGGNITIASADDGISSAKQLIIMNKASVSITTAYEGLESGEITIGSKSGTEDVPSVSIYSNDDGVNASSKTSVSYVYADEEENVYTKTETIAGNNVFYILAGNLDVRIADDTAHSYSLPVDGQSNVQGSYTANGDGVDCNGAFYAYGGTVTIYGSASGDNSPVDTDNTYCIGKGVTILAAGSSDMVENPTSMEQTAIAFGSSGGMNPGQMKRANGGGPGGQGQNNQNNPGQNNPGQNNPGQNNPGQNNPGQNGSSSISANTQVSVQDGSGNTVLEFTPPKAISYFLYSSPELSSTGTYSLYGNGEKMSAGVSILG